METRSKTMDYRFRHCYAAGPSRSDAHESEKLKQLTSAADNVLTEKIIWKAIDTNRQFTFPGTTGDLYELETLTNREWKNVMPTVYEAYRDKLKPRNFSLEQFKTNFYEMAPELRGFDLNNVLIAGGCPGNVVLNQPTTNDIDIFIYGLSEAEANAKVDALLKHLTTERQKRYNAHAQMYPDYQVYDAVKVMRNRHVSTIIMKSAGYRSNLKSNVNYIQLPRIKYQIIFKLYNTISEILHGFDISASSIGFNGQNVYVTGLGKLSFEYGIIVVNPLLRSATFEKRLIKYNNRGFALVMPHLNITKVRNELKDVKSLKLPFLTFNLGPVNNDSNDKVLSILLSESSNPTTTRPHDLSTPDEWANYNHVVSSGEIKYWNLRCLIANECSRFVYMVTKSTADVRYASSSAGLQSNEYPTFDFNDCHMQLSVEIIEKFYKDLPKMIWDNGTFKYNHVAKYIIGNPIDFASQLFSKSPKDQDAFVKSECLKSMNVALQRFKEYVDNHNNKRFWETKAPMAQFCPIVTTAVEYYGDYFNF